MKIDDVQARILDSRDRAFSLKIGLCYRDYQKANLYGTVYSSTAKRTEKTIHCLQAKSAIPNRLPRIPDITPRQLWTTAKIG